MYNDLIIPAKIQIHKIGNHEVVNIKKNESNIAKYIRYYTKCEWL